MITSTSFNLLSSKTRTQTFDAKHHIRKLQDGSLPSELAQRALAAVFLLILIPFLVIAAALIRMASPGPAIYRQVRVGHKGKTFVMFKLRSMIVDAERETGAILSWSGDPRITPIGRFLRALHVDEVPQLFNIVKGEMLFVGPRPERPEIVEVVTREMPRFRYRTEVKPGMTGLAQVYHSYNAHPSEKLELDLHFIRHLHLGGMRRFVLVNTIRKVLGLRPNPRIPYLHG